MRFLLKRKNVRIAENIREKFENIVFENEEEERHNWMSRMIEGRI